MGISGIMRPVAYMVHVNGVAPALPSGKAFGYVLAGNGVFKVAVSRLIEARVQLARVRVAGLPTLDPVVRAIFRVPGDVLESVLVDARKRSWSGPREAMYHVVIDREMVRVVRPEQIGTAGHLEYQGGGGPDIVCDLHSHHQMGAYFSETDNRDEKGFRFYGVVGRIFDRPEMALRIGVYGDMMRVPITALFTSTGPFKEAGGRRQDED